MVGKGLRAHILQTGHASTRRWMLTLALRFGEGEGGLWDEWHPSVDRKLHGKGK